MPFKDFYFGPFNGDLDGAPDPQNPAYIVAADGIRRTAQGYRRLAAVTDVTSTAPTNSNGGTGRLYPFNVEGTLNFMVATANATPSVDSFIYQSDDIGDSWSDIEGTSGPLGMWPDFAQYENLIIAVSPGVTPQYKDIHASTATVLQDLGGSPPTATVIARIQQHLVLGRLISANEEDLSAVQWDAIDDPTDWPTPGTADALSKQSGKQILPLELGDVTQVVGGEQFALIFQEHGITRMTYVGGNIAYEFDTFERQVGTGALDVETTIAAGAGRIPRPVIAIGDLFYWSNGWALYATDGYNVRKITRARLDTWTTSSIAASGCYDPNKEILMFLTSDTKFGSGSYLCWTPIADDFFFANTADYNSVAVYNGVIYNITSDDRLLQSNAAGVGETATLQTGFIEIVPGRLTKLIGARLIGAGSDSLTLNFKAVNDDESLSDGTSGFTAMTEQTRSLVHTAGSSALSRYHAFQVTGTLSANQIVRGIRVYYEIGPEL